MTAYKKIQTNRIKNFIYYIISAVMWVIIWHFAALYIDSEIFLPTPPRVWEAFTESLLPSADFRMSILTSLGNIGLGFLIGSLTGIVLAILSALCLAFKCFVSLPIKIIKSVPVASFVILSLLWFDSKELATFVTTLIVLPTIYINTLTGIEQTSKNLLDMATLFKIPILKRFLHIYVPCTIPYVLSACSLAVGMAWKAGVAAEIIGLAKNSIGNELYKAKLYYMTPELFAWTIVIVILSITTESLIKHIIKITCGTAGN